MPSEQVQGIPPAPLPTSYTITVVEGFNHEEQKTVKLVQLFLSTPAGMGVYFFPLDFATSFISQFELQLQQAKSGIVVAKEVPQNGGVLPFKPPQG